MKKFPLRNRVIAKLAFVVALLSVAPQSAAADDQQAASTTEPDKALVRVTLRVLAKGKGRPIGRVEVKSGESVAFTDPKGEVELMIPAGAKGSIQVSRAGYRTEQLALDSLLAKPNFDLYLFPATPDDNEVIVRGVKRPEVSRKTLSVKEASRIADGGDPVQVTKLMPGVQTQVFSPDVVVRGSAPQDSRYFIDAFEVPDIFHRLGNISVLPDQFTSDVEFSSGGFGPQYGDATGGIITLRTKSEIPEVPKTEFRVNLPLYSTLYHERAVGEDASIALSIRHSYIDKILPLVLPDDAPLTVVPYFADAHVMGYKRLSDGYFKVFSAGSMDGLKLAAPIDASTAEDGRGSVDLFTGFAILGAERMQNLSDKWSYSVSPQVLYQKFDADLFGTKLKWYGWSTALHTEFRHRRSANESTYIGFRPAAITLRSAVEAPVPQSDPFADTEDAPRLESSRSYAYNDAAAWISHDQQLGNLIATPGLRAFYSAQIKKAGVDPRFGWRYLLSKATSLKGAIGQYSRAPEFVESSVDFGNPDLDFERSFHYVLGLETAWSDKWNTDFQVFKKRTIDVIVSEASENYVNSGTLISQGFEVFVRRNMTERFFGWFSYTYSKSEERENDAKAFHPAQYDQTHVANLAGGYRVSATWDLGLRIGFHTGDTYTPLPKNLAVYDANTDKYRAVPGDVELYSANLPDYHQVDIFATKDFLFNTWELALRFGVQYLALSPQAFAVQYNYDYSDEEYVSGVPPIPYIELRGEI